jgi:outer membrane receptor protein involved in Fe transport
MGSNSDSVRIVVTVMLAALGLRPLAAVAQSAQSEQSVSEGLQEIVVTAERREERLQDVPVSLSAYSQEDLDTQGVRSIDDLSRVTPELYFQRMGLSGASNYNDENSDIAIRGIDSSAGASTTAVYLDDTPLQTRHLGFSTVNAFPELFDLDRVEVLRGPQGTLFGASAEGGAVRYISPEPSLRTDSGYVRSELATTQDGAPSYELGAAAGGPIVPDVLGFRVSASFRDDGGYVDRVNYRTLQTVEPNSNWQTTATLRAALKYAPTDELAITPSFYYQQLHLNDTGAYWPLLSNPGSGEFRNGNAGSDSSHDPWYVAAVKVEWNPGSVRLTSDTSYFSRHQSDTSDYTQFDRTAFLGNPFPPLGDFASAYFTDRQHNFIEDARLESADADSRLSWVAGIYYAHVSENATEYIADPNLPGEILAATGTPFLPPASQFGGFIYAQNPWSQIDKTVALYGQTDIKLTQKIKATLGLRVENAYTEGAQYYGGAFVGPVAATAAGSSTQHPVTPKAGLSYQPDADNLFYASAAKGYRIGGINAQLGGLCAPALAPLGLTTTPSTYHSDSLWSYEIGGKNTFFNHRLQIDSSIYFIDWKNIQQNIPLAICGLEFTTNLGAATSKGLDVDVRFKATDHLLLRVAGGYTDAHYTKTIFASAADTGLPIVSNGDHLPSAPWNIDLSGDYQFPAFNTRSPYVRVDYQLSTAQRSLLQLQDPANANSDPTIPGLPETQALSMRAGIKWSGFDVSLFGNNLLNTHPLLFSSHDTLVSPLYFDHTWRPRTVGVNLGYRY